jgi:phosphatidylglycerophosphate synthase
MLEQKLRPFLQAKLVDGVAVFLDDKIKPNTVTVLATIVGLLCAISLFINSYLCVALLLFSGYLDILDGSLARLQKTSSNFGTLLDILSDRLVEAFIIIAIFINQPGVLWVGFMMTMSIAFCMYSFLLVGMFSENSSQKSFYYSPGLIERAETFLFFIVMILLPSTVFYLGIIYTILVSWTTLYRCYEFYLYQQNKEK